jgi:hypothetical protein
VPGTVLSLSVAARIVLATNVTSNNVIETGRRMGLTLRRAQPP